MFLVSHSSAGGAQEIWANLAEQFLARGFDVKLAALYPLRDDVRETSDDLPWTYIVPARPKGVFGAIGLVISFVRFLRKDTPDYIFTAMPAANVLAPIAVWLARVSTRTIISHHSPADTHNGMLNKVDGISGSLRNVKFVISVSNTVGDSLAAKPKAYLDKRKTIYNALPPPVENQLAALRAKTEPRMARGRKVVATGRLAPQKNYAVLLRAAVYMPDVQVDIVGGGPDEAKLKALAAELGVTDRVHFLGHRRREEALQILSSADVFTQPSLFEGHSLALIEAAKLDLPLVVSSVPVQIEGITASDKARCGIAVDAHDDKALASEILRLLEDPAYYARWRDAARHLASDITFDRMIASYEELMT